MRRIVTALIVASAFPGCGGRPPDPASPADRPATGYVANRSSRVVHRADCRSAPQIKPANRITFAALADPLAEGYVPCRFCLPRAGVAPARDANGAAP